ncbi:DUF4062 domain-containing protein [Microbacterium stercoris]|nr:DUF4062 domain-containing protein [Microbacterium stercoris]
MLVVGGTRYVGGMGFSATVLTVMIASPSDTVEARDAVQNALWSWNDANARTRGVMLLPWRWETSAVPVLGGAPQALINAQGLERADIVFALFGSRLGSPTEEAVSGTVEEIEGATARDVPVHLFFSTAPLPHDVDLAQVQGLRAFKAEVQERGLYGEYANVTELSAKVWQAVEHDLAGMDLGALVATSATPPEDITWLVQPGSENRVEYSSKGVPRNRTHRWIDVTNRHLSRDAENVTLSANTDESGLLAMGREGSMTIHAGQTYRLVTMRGMGGGGEVGKLTVAWDEEGERRQRTYDVG